MALSHFGLEFKIEAMADPHKATKSKLPYVDLAGKVIANSELIFEYFDEVSQVDLYGDLTQLARPGYSIRAWLPISFIG